MIVKLRIWWGVVVWCLAILCWQVGAYLFADRDVQAIVLANAVASERGKVARERCGACHALTGRENRIGPHLVNVVDRAAGSVADFAYSEAMKSSKLVWSRAQLKAFLLDPQRTVPGTAMAIGSTTPSDADEIIVYLENK